MRRIKMRK